MEYIFYDNVQLMTDQTIAEGEALKNFFKGLGYKMEDIAKALGMTRQNLNYHLRKLILDEDFKRLVADKLKIDFTNVKKGKLALNNPSQPNGKKSEVIPLGVEVGFPEKGNNGLEFIALSNGQLLMGVPHVNEYVYGGYLTGFKDPEFIEEMPKHFIPVAQRHRGRYLSFTMRGESMKDGTERSISPGDVITGREIQRKYWTSSFHTKDFPEFIIHTKDQGVVVKQIVEHNLVDGWISLHSYNPKFKDYKVMLDDCVEIFNVIEVSKKNRNQY